MTQFTLIVKYMKEYTTYCILHFKQIIPLQRSVNVAGQLQMKGITEGEKEEIH